MATFTANIKRKKWELFARGTVIAIVPCLFALNIGNAAPTDTKDRVHQEASTTDFPDQVKQTVAAGRDINGRDVATGETFLTQAAFDNHEETVKDLLEHGANVNVMNRHNLTPLMCAAMMGHPGIVEILLDRGAYVNMRNRDGYTALMLAVCKLTPEEEGVRKKIHMDLRYRPAHKSESDVKRIVTMLINKGANVTARNRVDDDHSAMAVNMAGNYAEAGQLLEKAMIEGPDADPYGERNIVRVWQTPPRNVSSAGRRIITQNNEKAVRAALKRGQDINDMNDIGNTVLMRAAVEGNTDMVNLLFEFKPDLNLPSWVDGMTALMLALKYNRTEIAAILLSHGADINAQDFSGHTPLMRAALEGKAETAAWLVKYGAAQDKKDFYGNTAFSLALLNGQQETAELLKGRMEQKAALREERDTLLRKRFLEAASLGDVASLASLVKSGADVNSRDESGKTALMLAAATDRLDAVKLLLAEGANVSETDAHGVTALRNAKKEGHKDIVRILKKTGAKE